MFLAWQLWLGVSVVAAGCVWLLINTGDPRLPTTDGFGKPIAPPPKTRRDELLEARAQVRHQLEILKSPQRGSDYTSFSAEAAQKLQDILDGIEEELGENPRG
ncbi:MAG TPA: hypothetical protein VGH23_11930 [Rhizomicrobium sp.]|jgi:hypothetical protein